MTTESNAAVAAEEKSAKSIVPAKYSGKYKDGGADALSTFIKEQCTGKEGFEFTAFFELARKNGLPEEKVSHYEGQVNEKKQGAAGRARMTLRNMLASIARKNGGLVALDDTVVALDLPKAVLGGAAAKAKETAEQETATAE